MPIYVKKENIIKIIIYIYFFACLKFSYLTKKKTIYDSFVAKNFLPLLKQNAVDYDYGCVKHEKKVKCTDIKYI